MLFLPGMKSGSHCIGAVETIQRGKCYQQKFEK
jgi:hypothetical protein